MLARRGRATGYKAGNGSVSRAASNQQFARTSRRCDGLGSRGPFGREIARCQTVPVFGPSCDGFRTAQGVVLDWPVVWGEIKMAARQPVACRTPLAILPTRASSCRWFQCAEKDDDNTAAAAQRLAQAAADGRHARNQQKLAALCDSQGAPLGDMRPAGTGMWRLLANLRGIPIMHHVRPQGTRQPKAVRYPSRLPCCLDCSRWLPCPAQPSPVCFHPLSASPLPYITRTLPTCNPRSGFALVETHPSTCVLFPTRP
jgi:hypothetical protein